jgi:hypothetical protein
MHCLKLTIEIRNTTVVLFCSLNWGAQADTFDNIARLASDDSVRTRQQPWPEVRLSHYYTVLLHIHNTAVHTHAASAHSV